MRKLFWKIANIGSERFESPVDQTHQRLSNICCMAGIAFSLFLIIYDLLLGFTHISLISVYGASALCFAVFIYLNYLKLYSVSSHLAAVTPLIIVLICLKITGSQVNYELLLIGLALSPYLFFVKSRFVAFIIFFVYIVVALEMAFSEVTPLVIMEYGAMSSMEFLAKSAGIFVLLFGAVVLNTLGRAALREIEHKRDEVEKAKIQVERSEKLKTTFLKNMSHEIRTPLNGIIGFTEMIMNSSMSISKQERDEYAEIINKSSQQLLSVVSNVLDISKLEIGEVKVEYEAVNIRAIARELIKEYEPRAKEKGLEFGYEIKLDDAASTIKTDKKKIQQMLASVLHNAVKFTKAGSVHFSYKLDEAEDNIVFQVADTGPGIPRHLQSKIFERFHRIEVDTARGAGLGLAISQGFAEMLEGEITLDSIVNSGTTFYIRHPYELEELTEVVEIVEEVREARTIEDFGAKKVLVAEDETFNYKLLEALLKRLGYEVLWAKNGLAAVELSTQHDDLDLILMDIKMPIMNGIEATEKIRTKYPKVPIVGQSAFAFANEQEEAIEAGCNAYLTKPIKRQELLDTLVELFEEVEAR